MSKGNGVRSESPLIGQDRVLATDRQSCTAVRRTRGEDLGTTVIGDYELFPGWHAHDTSRLGEYLQHLLQIVRFEFGNARLLGRVLGSLQEFLL